jgi:hypothetical protein
MTRVAAFDLSSATGIGFWGGLAPAPKLFTKKVVGYDYCIEDMMELWRVYLRDFYEKNQPELVVIEESVIAVFQSKAESGDYNRAAVNGQSVMRLIALSAMTRWFFRKKGCRVLIVTPQQWRKSAYGKAVLNSGENWKSKAEKRARELGWSFDTHNAAEAGHMLDWLLLQLKIQSPWRDADFMRSA